MSETTLPRWRVTMKDGQVFFIYADGHSDAMEKAKKEFVTDFELVRADLKDEQVTMQDGRITTG